MKRTQKGITLTSFVIVLAVVGFFALMTMKLFPMYSEYYSVKRVMDELAATPKSASMSGPQIQIELERRFNIGYVESVKKEHVKVIRAGKGSKLNIAYEVRVPLLGNLDAVGRFDNTVDLSGTSAGG
jgi:Tfp pilus assembly protein PilE